MKLKPSIYLTLITYLLLLTYNAYSETSETNSLFDKLTGQVNLTYISSEVDMKNSVITFMGDVEVTGSNMTMTCQKLVIRYKKLLKNSSIKESDYGIEKIMATDSVVITRPGRGMAKADEAVYFHDSRTIVLTGDPYLKIEEGEDVNEIKGAQKITLDLGEERYFIEATKENPGNATINIPDEEER